MTMAKMLTSSDGNDIDLYVEIKRLDVRIMCSPPGESYVYKIHDMTMAIRRYGDDDNDDGEDADVVRRG